MSEGNNSGGGCGWYLLISFIVFIAVAAANALYKQALAPPSQRLTFGKLEVYFEKDIDQGEAQKLGDLLVREKDLGDRPAAVQIRQNERRYDVRFVVRKGAEVDPQVTEWEELGNMISRECFREAPVDIHLCDENLKTLRVIAFQPRPPLIIGLKGGWDSGVFNHDLLLTNGSSNELSEVEVTITLFREDGERVPVKKFWSRWSENEIKKINVSAHGYQKVEIQGTALSGSTRVRIESSW